MGSVLECEAQLHAGLDVDDWIDSEAVPLHPEEWHQRAVEHARQIMRDEYSLLVGVVDWPWVASPLDADIADYEMWRLGCVADRYGARCRLLDEQQRAWERLFGCVDSWGEDRGLIRRKLDDEIARYQRDRAEAQPPLSDSDVPDGISKTAFAVAAVLIDQYGMTPEDFGVGTVDDDQKLADGLFAASDVEEENSDA